MSANRSFSSSKTIEQTIDTNLTAIGEWVIYEFQYDLAFQNFGDSEYIDIGIMDRDKFDAHVTNDDPSPHSDALENYQSDGTGQTDNNNTLRSTTGAGRIDLSESTTDKVICLGAYNANATDVKEVTWWHTYWWIWEVAL